MTSSRSKAALIVPLACLFLAGCLLRLVYPRLDTLFVWRLDREFGLERQQRRALRTQMEELLSWHRREQLPHWRDWLRSVRDDVAATRMPAERYAEHRRRLEGLLRETAGGFRDVCVSLAASLNDAQVARFLARHDEATEDLREELAEKTAAERVEERRDEVVERAASWLGSLTPAQEQVLAEWSREALDWNAHALESRQRWRAALAEMLAARNDQQRLRTDIERLLRRPESLRSPAYREAVERYVLQIQALHVSLLETLTDEQRDHLVDEIDDLLEDLVALVGA